MSVPSTVTDLSATAALNSPSGSESIGTALDDYLRSHAAIIRQVSDAKANSGANADITSLSGISGNLAFTGIGNRITGDFSNATFANRVMFQTSTVNSATVIGVLPNGTGNESDINLYAGNIPANTNFATIGANTTAAYLNADKTGTGSYVPLLFQTGGSERVRIDTSGNVFVTNSGGGLGYGAGSGGTVTQATSKSTAVTLNKPSGQITMHNASLAAGATVQFDLNNSLVTAADIIFPSIYRLGIASSANYNVWIDTGISTAKVNVKNISAGSLSEALVINFAIIKGATT